MAYNVQLETKMQFIGNKKTVSFLNNTIKSGNINHAYLFTGPQHVGKKTLARIFAANVISSNKNLDFSISFTNNVLTDLIEISPEKEEKKGIIKEKDISVETVRLAQEKLSLYPHFGKYKILIIDNAHQMTIAAQNAILKTLEEPNQTSIMILVSHQQSNILPTIISRCQNIAFSLVDGQSIEKSIENETSLNAKEISLLSLGRPAIAKRLINDSDEYAFRKNAALQFEELKNYSLNEKIALAEEMSKDASKTIEKLTLWIWIIRNNLFENKNQNIDYHYLVIEKIENCISLLEQTNASSKLVLENLLINL